MHRVEAIWLPHFDEISVRKETLKHMVCRPYHGLTKNLPLPALLFLRHAHMYTWIGVRAGS